MKKLVMLIVVGVALASCSQSAPLQQFGDIWVSDPYVSDSQLKVEIRNETGRDLCYFGDGLFYGKNAIEGGVGATEIRRPVGGALPLEELEFHKTGYVTEKLRKMEGEHEIIWLDLNRGPINAGDYVSFDIFYCDTNEAGLHQTFSYSSRLR